MSAQERADRAREDDVRRQRAARRPRGLARARKPHLELSLAEGHREAGRRSSRDRAGPHRLRHERQAELRALSSARDAHRQRRGAHRGASVAIASMGWCAPAKIGGDPSPAVSPSGSPIRSGGSRSETPPCCARSARFARRRFTSSATCRCSATSCFAARCSRYRSWTACRATPGASAGGRSSRMPGRIETRCIERDRSRSPAWSPTRNRTPTTATMDRVGGFIEAWGWSGGARLGEAAIPLLGRGLRRHAEALSQAKVIETDAGHLLARGGPR